MGKAPTWRAGANLGKAMAGAGILAQPSVAHALGLGWWFVAWTAAMGISGYTMYLVSRSKISADEIAGPAPHTLSDLTLKITKNARCARAVEALVCVLQMSFGVGYVVVMLSLVCRALVPSLARWAACLALAPLAGCLALIPDLNRLTLVSVLGLLVTVVGVVGLSGGYALTSDAFEVHLWGSAGPGTPSCSWGVLIRHVGSCAEFNHWFGGSPPNFRSLYLNQIEVDSADFWTDQMLSSSSRSIAKESGPNCSITRTLKSG